MLAVVHHPDYAVPTDSQTFGWSKYRYVMDALVELAVPHRRIEPEPMPTEWLRAVHDPAYVAQVLAASVPPAVERRIGFAVTAAVARRAQLSVGGTYLASRIALEEGWSANAAGGSHHAHHASGAGYCVFNDLAVASHRLLAEGLVKRILIIDLDVHQGDGTAAMLAGRDDIFTLSVHAEKNFPVRKACSSLDLALPDGTGDAAYLAMLEQHLPDVISDFRPDFIFYQAGVDAHRDDKLGRLALSDAGLVARDRYICAMATRHGLPLTSTLGGGYGDDRLALAQRHARAIAVLAEQEIACLHAFS
jgi:acetoin utilization deacetylase AcuC-like enzyme